MEFSRKKYWSRLPFSSPWDLPDPGIEPRSPALQVDSLLSEPPGSSGNLYTVHHSGCNNLHSHQQCRRVFFFPHPLQHLLLVDFLLIDILNALKRYLIVAFTCISLVISMLRILHVPIGHLYVSFGKMCT